LATDGLRALDGNIFIFLLGKNKCTEKRALNITVPMVEEEGQRNTVFVKVEDAQPDIHCMEVKGVFGID